MQGCGRTDTSSAYLELVLFGCLAGQHAKGPSAGLEEWWLCRRDILGLILVKELALVDLEASIHVSEVKMRQLPMLRADTAM